MTKKLLLAMVMLPVVFGFTNCQKKKKSDLSPSNGADTSGPKPVVESAYAFPGAEGFGRNATGGRAGKVIKVTNLNDAGAGSLRAAVEATGPRIVVFEISGTIALKRRLVIRNKDITIAGQTAPGDGICLRNYEVTVGADNVVVRYMRFRMGDTEQQEGDAFGGRFQKNIIVDHCSMSWSTDECVSFYANENFTLQWCLITESLRNSVHGKGAHGYGGVWGGKYASFHHNLMANHDSRNPRFGEEAGKAFALTDLVDMRNNVFYNWGPTNNAYGGEGMNINIINNYYKPGPATTKKERIFSIDKNNKADTEVYNIWGKFYINGNYVNESTRTSNDNWNYGVFNQFHGSYGTVSEGDKLAMKLNNPLVTDDNVTTHTALQAYDKVLDYAGAVLKRDAIDMRTVLHTRNKTFYKAGSNGSTNGIIDTQADVDAWPLLQSLPALPDTDGDGMPDDWEKSKSLDPKVANAAGRDLSTAYDNLEVYINSLVAVITENQVK